MATEVERVGVPTVAAVTDTPHEAGGRARAAAVVLEGVAAGYGESLVVREATMRIDPGEVVCLMGRNGVGKTTLIKTIMGLVPARAGRISLDGRALAGVEPHRRARAGIGYVPQGRGIFPYLSVAENLRMGFEATGRLDLAAVEEVETLFPVLGQMRRRTAGTLSGGQQQQLALARALVQRPRLLLLDEPTEGIQPSIVAEIEALLQAIRARRGTSVLVVEQFVEFALAVADRYYVMADGTVVAEGTTSQLADHTVREHLAV